MGWHTEIINCPECNGTGENGICGWCRGYGEVLNTVPGPPNVKCLHCGGSCVEPGGCPYCHGSGEVEKRVFGNDYDDEEIF